MKDYYILSNQQKDASSYYELFDDKTKIYVVDHYVDGHKYQYQDAYRYIEQDAYSNMLLYGGWLSGSPIEKYQCDRLNIDNISRDMLYRNDVFFCTYSRSNIVKQFLKEHYTDGYVSASIYDTTSVCNVISYNIDNTDEMVEVEYSDYSVRKPTGSSDLYHITVNIDLKDIDSHKGLFISMNSNKDGEAHVFRAFKDEIIECDDHAEIVFKIQRDEWALVSVKSLKLYQE